ncbi:hypothetical protein B296_00049220, partial [Ensete ventricosum]
MHPLRFPNGGIRAKATRRAASPHARPTTHDQAIAKAPCKGAAGQGQPAREASDASRGSSLQGRPTPLAGTAAARGHTHLKCSACKGGQLQGARKGLPPAASPAASRGDGTGRKG